MKKPVLILAITAVATFVMGWVAHRVYRNSQQAEQEIITPANSNKNLPVSPVSIDSSTIKKDSSIYQHTNFVPPKKDSLTTVVKDTTSSTPKTDPPKFAPVKKFSDYSVSAYFKHGLSKKLDFTTCSSGLLYLRETKKAVEKGSVFAGRYAFVEINCDSNCFSSSIVDLKSGQVFAGPHATTGYKYRIDSRLLLVNPPKSDSSYDDCFDCTPELYVWTGKLFKKIQ